VVPNPPLRRSRPSGAHLPTGPRPAARTQRFQYRAQPLRHRWRRCPRRPVLKASGEQVGRGVRHPVRTHHEVESADDAFYRSELYSLARRIDEHLVRWAMQMFKRFRHKPSRAWDCLAKTRRLAPTLFAHWKLARTTNNRLVGAVRLETITYDSARAEGGGSLPPLTRRGAGEGVVPGGRKRQPSRIRGA